MKSLEELRNQVRRVANIVLKEGLTVEEALYVFECAKFILTEKRVEEMVKEAKEDILRRL